MQTVIYKNLCPPYNDCGNRSNLWCAETLMEINFKRFYLCQTNQSSLHFFLTHLVFQQTRKPFMKRINCQWFETMSPLSFTESFCSMKKIIGRSIGLCWAPSHIMYICSLNYEVLMANILLCVPLTLLSWWSLHLTNTITSVDVHHTKHICTTG